MKFKRVPGGDPIEGATVRDVAVAAVAVAKRCNDSVTFVEQDVPNDRRRQVVVHRLPKRENRQVIGHSFIAELLFPRNGKPQRSRRVAADFVPAA